MDEDQLHAEQCGHVLEGLAFVFDMYHSERQALQYGFSSLDYESVCPWSRIIECFLDYQGKDDTSGWPLTLTFGR
jgi:hypothetical protein